jgi:hypothetical protein
MSVEGRDAIASPTSGPVPQTRLKTPGGTPASAHISANTYALSGATSAGLHTTVHPAAIAAPALEMTDRRGAFHAVIAPTTPAASRRTVVFPITSAHEISRRLRAMMSSSSTAPPVCDLCAHILPTICGAK